MWIAGQCQHRVVGKACKVSCIPDHVRCLDGYAVAASCCRGGPTVTQVIEEAPNSGQGLVSLFVAKSPSLCRHAR